jgi:hypothetical protein
MSDNYCEHCGGRFTTQPGMIEKLCTCDIENLTEQKRGQMETQVRVRLAIKPIELYLMTITIDIIFYVISAIFFLLDAIQVQSKIKWFSLAFFFLTLSLIF